MRDYLARFHFINKLYFLIIPPMIILLLFMDYNLFQVYKQYQGLQKIKKSILLSVEIGSLVHKIQVEKGLSAGFTSSKGEQFAKELKMQRKRVDTQFSHLQELSYVHAKKRDLQEITLLRKKINSKEIAAQAVIRFYSKIIVTNLKEISTITKQSQNTYLARTLLSYSIFLHVEECLGVERAIGMIAFSDQKFLPNMHTQLLREVTKKDLFLELFLLHGHKKTIALYQKMVGSHSFYAVDKMQKTLQETKDLKRSKITPKYWFATISKEIDFYKQIDKMIAKNMIGHIEHQRSHVRWRLAKGIVLYLLLFIGAILTSLYVSKSIFKEFNEQQKMLLQQSKMATMGEMIGAISHQWRQPLNAVGVLAQEIEFKCEGDLLEKGELQALNKKLLEYLDYMSTTIDDFRNFFKPNKEKKIFDLKKAIQESVKIVSKQLDAHGIDVKVRTRCSASGTISSECTYEFEGYESEFKQVIINLLNNAREAIEERMKEESGLVGKIDIFIDRDATDFIIHVKDNGGGIDEKLLDSIFDIYISSKKEQQGTGLGLYLSKLIIERNMSGLIKAKNIEEGAEFEIFLLTDI